MLFLIIPTYVFYVNIVVHIFDVVIFYLNIKTTVPLVLCLSPTET